MAKKNTVCFNWVGVALKINFKIYEVHVKKPNASNYLEEYALLAPTFTSHLNLRVLETPPEINSVYATGGSNPKTVACQADVLTFFFSSSPRYPLSD